MRSVSLSPVGNHMAGKFSPGLMLLKWPWLGFRGFSSHFWLPLGIGIVMKVSREFWFYPRERDDLPKNRDLIDIVWLLLNKCGSDWWSYAKMSFNEWFSELLLTKHGTWSLIHMNGMIYQQLEMVISHDLYNSKKKCGDITRVQQLFHKQYPCGCVLKWCMPPNHLVYEETDDNAFNRGLKNMAMAQVLYMYSYTWAHLRSNCMVRCWTKSNNHWLTPAVAGSSVLMHIIYSFTIWLFNIAMENPPIL